MTLKHTDLKTQEEINDMLIKDMCDVARWLRALITVVCILCVITVFILGTI